MYCTQQANFPALARGHGTGQWTMCMHAHGNQALTRHKHSVNEVRREQGQHRGLTSSILMSLSIKNSMYTEANSTLDVLLHWDYGSENN